MCRIQRWGFNDGYRTTMVDDGHTNKDKDEGEDDYDNRMPPAVNTMVDDYAPSRWMMPPHVGSDWTMGIQRWLSRDDGSRTTMVDDGHTNKDQDEGKDDYDIRMPPAVNKMVDIKNTCDVPACWLKKKNENKIYILTDKSRDYCDTPCNFSYCTYVAL